MLYVIGLGLWDEKDISVRGLETVRACHKVYLEAYTSILLVDKEKLEAFYGREVTVATREDVEQKIDTVLQEAVDADVAFLVVGDPFSATTHTDLVIRATRLGVTVNTIPNASVLTAVGISGLQLYRFGEVISIPFFSSTWQPDSFYDKILANQKMGLHTLCLLDIKVKEPSLEAMARGKIVYGPPRYMTVNVALTQLLLLEERRQEGVCRPDMEAVGLARLGSDSQTIIFGRVSDLLNADFGPPLHSLVLPGAMHVIEREMLDFFKYGDNTKKLNLQEEKEDEEYES